MLSFSDKNVQGTVANPSFLFTCLVLGIKEKQHLISCKNLAEAGRCSTDPSSQHLEGSRRCHTTVLGSGSLSPAWERESGAQVKQFMSERQRLFQELTFEPAPTCAQGSLVVRAPRCCDQRCPSLTKAAAAPLLPRAAVTQEQPCPPAAAAAGAQPNPGAGKQAREASSPPPGLLSSNNY